MIRAVSPAGSSVASTTLDDVCGLDDDQMSSLGETLANNLISDGSGAVSDPFDAQFLRQVAELNRQMSAQLDGLPRSAEKARQTPVDTLAADDTKSTLVPDTVRALLLHSTAQAIGQNQTRQQQIRQRPIGKRYKAQRRPTLELLTSDDEANEYTEQQISSYLEPQARQSRQAEEPNHRSSFETLYGFAGSSEISADWYDDEPDGPLTWPDGLQQKQDRVGKLSQDALKVQRASKTQSDETLLQKRKNEEQQKSPLPQQVTQFPPNQELKKPQDFQPKSLPQAEAQKTEQITSISPQQLELKLTQKPKALLQTQRPRKHHVAQNPQQPQSHKIEQLLLKSTAHIQVLPQIITSRATSFGIPEAQSASKESFNQSQIGSHHLPTGLAPNSTGASVQLPVTPNNPRVQSGSSVPVGATLTSNSNLGTGNSTAGSEAAKRRGEAQKCRLHSRRTLISSHQNQSQQQPLSFTENHVSRVNFLVPSSAQPELNDASAQESSQALSIQQRLTRTVRFRSGSFSDFNYYYPAPRQQLSNLEIGVLRQCPPPPLWPADRDKASATHFVVTQMRRVDYSDPVSELELMCRAMRLNDADLMEGAAKRDTNAAPFSSSPVAALSARRWSSSGHHQQQQRDSQRQNHAMSRPVRWPDPVRDDQAKRRVEKQEQQRSSGPTGAPPNQPSFIGRASDGERARQQVPVSNGIQQRYQQQQVQMPNLCSSSAVSNTRGSKPAAPSIIHQSTRLILSNLAEYEDDEDGDEAQSHIALSDSSAAQLSGGRQRHNSHAEDGHVGATRTSWQWMPQQSVRIRNNSAQGLDRASNETSSVGGTTDVTGDDQDTSEDDDERMNPACGTSASLLRKAASLNDVIERKRSNLQQLRGPEQQLQKQQQQQQRFWKTLEVRYGSESNLSLSSNSTSNSSSFSGAAGRPRCTSSYFVHIHPQRKLQQPLLEEKED